jgi:CRP/FNR family transcriptional regulator
LNRVVATSVITGAVALSHVFTEIAQELNSSREVISRLMKKLAEKGHIRMNKQHIEILNLNL